MGDGAADSWASRRASAARSFRSALTNERIVSQKSAPTPMDGTIAARAAVTEFTAPVYVA